MSDKWYNYQHMTFQTGQRIGSYRVLRHIGSGGMGEVYEVVHEQLQSRYAMKVFVAAGGNAALLRERFLAEARAMNRLRHPRIVRVYDLGIENDHPYLVMDLMVDSKGEPATMAAAKLKGGISEEKIYGWYLDLREALNTIHKAGIVHRDVKPVNVLLDADGRAMLSDFGVARYEGEIKCALDRKYVCYRPGRFGASCFRDGDLPCAGSLRRRERNTGERPLFAWRIGA